MSTADASLQVAALAALRADAGVKVLIGDPARLYDMVPASPEYPFVSLGDRQNVPDPAECIDGSDVFLTLHAWSRSTDSIEASAIVSAIDTVLHDAALTLVGNRCVQIKRDGSRVLLDPDGITIHGVATYRARVEPA